MKKALIILILSININTYSQEVSNNYSYNITSKGELISGSFIELDIINDSTTINIDDSHITINSTGQVDKDVVLTNLEPIGIDVVDNVNIERYKCYNYSGDMIICSISNNAISMLNTMNNKVVTYIKYKV